MVWYVNHFYCIFTQFECQFQTWVSQWSTISIHSNKSSLKLPSHSNKSSLKLPSHSNKSSLKLPSHSNKSSLKLPNLHHPTSHPQICDLDWRNDDGEAWGDVIRTDFRFAPSQWETALLCNDVSHWLGASLECGGALWPWWHEPDDSGWRHNMDTLFPSLGGRNHKSQVDSAFKIQYWVVVHSLMVSWTSCWTSSRISGYLGGHYAHATSLPCEEK